MTSPVDKFLADAVSAARDHADDGVTDGAATRLRLRESLANRGATRRKRFTLIAAVLASLFGSTAFAYWAGWRPPWSKPAAVSEDEAQDKVSMRLPERARGSARAIPEDIAAIPDADIAAIPDAGLEENAPAPIETSTAPPAPVSQIAPTPATGPIEKSAPVEGTVPRAKPTATPAPTSTAPSRTTTPAPSRTTPSPSTAASRTTTPTPRIDTPAPTSTAPSPTAPSRTTTPAPTSTSPSPTSTSPSSTPAPRTDTPAPTSKPAPAPRIDTPAPTPDPELAAYRNAHQLHFRGTDPKAALAAWDAYLAQFPNGKLAPEARYDRALVLVKLARWADARAALAPFANAPVGTYRQKEAAEILAAIRDR